MSLEHKYAKYFARLTAQYQPLTLTHVFAFFRKYFDVPLHIQRTLVHSYQPHLDRPVGQSEFLSLIIELSSLYITILSERTAQKAKQKAEGEALVKLPIRPQHKKTRELKEKNQAQATEPQQEVQREESVALELEMSEVEECVQLMESAKEDSEYEGFSINFDEKDYEESERKAQPVETSLDWEIIELASLASLT